MLDITTIILTYNEEIHIVVGCITFNAIGDYRIGLVGRILR